MSQIKLKINFIRWLAINAILFLGIFIIMSFKSEGYDTIILLLGAFAASFAVVFTIASVFYYSQKKVIITEHEIIKFGFWGEPFIISYDEIKEIKAGIGGFVISKHGNSIIISNFYSNFEIAREAFEQLVQKNEDITLTGWEKHIRKHFGNYS